MAKKLTNKFWFKLHGWCFLPIWLLFCVICLTGTIAVISHELTWLTNPAARAVNPEQLPERSAGELLRLFQEQHPSADVMGLNLREPYLTHVVMFTDSDKPYALAYLNQYTGEVQEVNNGVTFINFMRYLHGWLLFPWQEGYSVGYYLVSAMSILLLGALITGLIVYKKFWKALFNPKLRTHQGPRTFAADFHKLSGVWSIWFMAVMSLTGGWYLAQGIMWHSGYELEPHTVLAADEMPTAPIDSNSNYLTIDQTLQALEPIFPELRPSYIMMPEHNRDTLKISASDGYVLYDDYSINVAVNPVTQHIVAQSSPNDMNLVQTLLHIADPLHYGTWGGLWSKLVWFLFGAILTSMSITGFIMYSIRNKRMQQTGLSETLVGAN
ncbi:PepSY-associated TM helix domain-containing protein [Pseudoalteromonas fenneropenaei]|uniref:PepSY-associated TM helix domain-containing protein n=1 Tax=Pseudoalteromonas fenneropenaei TaxID=1737459 RepID=A0ABV7CJ16_9GAMM